VKAYQRDRIYGLIPKFSERGKKSKQPKEVIELMEKARKIFLSPDGTLKKAYHFLKKECNKKSLPIPSLSAFRHYIYDNTSASERALLKKGKLLFNALYSLLRIF